MPEEKARTGLTVHASSIVRFGPYELDLRSAELRKNRLKIRLQEQPFQILIALLERPGELVLREEIRQKLWPDETVVEFDHSINAAVKRLRDALCESAEEPRNIETLARRGYRFIGKAEYLADPVDTNGKDPVQVQPLVEDPPAGLDELPASPPLHEANRKNWWIAASALAIVVLAAGAWATLRRHSKVKSTPEMTRLTFDSGLTTDPAVSPGRSLARSRN